MADWLTFLSGSAAGGAAGVVAGSLIGNIAQQLLQEWRDTKGDQRERQREQRSDARALRDAKKVAVFPALDALFDAAMSITRGVEELMTILQSQQRSDDSVFGSKDALYSQRLVDAMVHVADALMVIQREIDAPDVVYISHSLDELYREFDHEASHYREDVERTGQCQFLLSLLEEMDADASALQASVLVSKATLEKPL